MEITDIYQLIHENTINQQYIKLSPKFKDSDEPMISPSGRRMWVDYDIDCVCIEFDYWGGGETKTLQIPFAKYRYEKLFAFGTNGLYTPELYNDCNLSILISGKYLSAQSDIPAITDENLQTTLSPYQIDKTGKEYTDAWMQYTDYVDNEGTIGVPAIQACRNLSTKGIAVAGYFDCPNVYELAIAWIESDNIDLLDPTAEEYPNRKLGKTNPEGRFRGNTIWTSTGFNERYTRDIMFSGIAAYISKTNEVDYCLPCKVV